MPVTEQDVRALTYLARRLRAEAGGSAWDEAGALAAVSQLTGRELAASIERITRHATDPEARTPAAIHRPFLPPPASTAGPTGPRRRDQCTTCGDHIQRCHCDNPSVRIQRSKDAAGWIDRLRKELPTPQAGSPSRPAATSPATDHHPQDETS